ILHRDPIRVVVFAEVEDGGDVRMRDPRRDSRFVEEHLDERFVLDEMGMDFFDRDPLLETAGAIHPCEMDARHAADPDLVDDAIATEEIGSSTVPRARARARYSGRAAAPRNPCVRGIARGAPRGRIRAVGTIVGQGTSLRSNSTMISAR